MKLVVKLFGLGVSRAERSRLEGEFRDAVLNWQPSVELLLKCKNKRNRDYFTMLSIGTVAVQNLLGKERTKYMKIDVSIIGKPNSISPRIK